MKRLPRSLNQRGFHHIVMPLIVFVLLFGIGGAYFYLTSNAATNGTELQLGSDKALCLDNNRDASATRNKVDIYGCNNTAAQDWTFQVVGTNRFLLHDNAGTCLDEVGDGGSGALVQTYGCNSSDHAQLFGWQNHQLQNIYSGVCVNDPAYSKTNGTQLIMYACKSTSNEQWYEASQASGSTGGGGNVTPTDGYANPMRSAHYSSERIDQGVDYGGSGPVYAIGPGVIEGSSTGAGWPSGVFIRYRLTSGIGNGVYIYVAEDCSPKVSLSTGTKVSSSTVLCDMYGGSSGIETGFAEPASEGYIAMAHSEYAGQADGMPTNFGVKFSSFMKSLGGPGGNISQSTGSGSRILSSTPLPSNIANL